MARDRATSPSESRPMPGARSINRARRALLALSPAALGVAGFVISGLRRGTAAAAAEPAPAGGSRAEEMTDHRKAYYDRARF